jgi:hypothetical protein
MSFIGTDDGADGAPSSGLPLWLRGLQGARGPAPDPIAGLMAQIARDARLPRTGGLIGSGYARFMADYAPPVTPYSPGPRLATAPAAPLSQPTERFGGSPPAAPGPAPLSGSPPPTVPGARPAQATPFAHWLNPGGQVVTQYDRLEGQNVTYHHGTLDGVDGVFVDNADDPDGPQTVFTATGPGALAQGFAPAADRGPDGPPLYQKTVWQNGKAVAYLVLDAYGAPSRPMRWTVARRPPLRCRRITSGQARRSSPWTWRSSAAPSWGWAPG